MTRGAREGEMDDIGAVTLCCHSAPRGGARSGCTTLARDNL